MDINYYDRFELLMEMARYFSSSFHKQLAGRNILGTERKCWHHLYELMSTQERAAVEMNQHECEFINTKELAHAAFSYPYSINATECQKELWRLFVHYDRLIEKKGVPLAELKEVRQLIMRLLFQSKWNNADLQMGKVLVERAVLHYFFLPIIHYQNNTECQNRDAPPF